MIETTNLVNKTLPDQIESIFIKRITRYEITGTLPSIEEICNEFNVSRTVAREAISKLETLRLIKIQSGKRIEILPDTEWNFLDPKLIHGSMPKKKEQVLLELGIFRNLVEPQIVEMAVDKATQEDLNKLIKTYQNMESSIGNREAFYKFDMQFHRQIVDITGNLILRYIMKSVRDLQKASIDAASKDLEGIPTALSEHKEILDAMLDRDATRAKLMMELHLERHEKTLLSRLERRSKDTILS